MGSPLGGLAGYALESTHRQEDRGNTDAGCPCYFVHIRGRPDGRIIYNNRSCRTHSGAAKPSTIGGIAVSIPESRSIGPTCFRIC